MAAEPTLPRCDDFQDHRPENAGNIGRTESVAFLMGAVATLLYMGSMFWDLSGAGDLTLLWGLTAGYLALHGMARRLMPYGPGTTVSWRRLLGYWAAIFASLAALVGTLPLIIDTLASGEVGDAATTAFWRGVTLTLVGALLLLTHIELARSGLACLAGVRARRSANQKRLEARQRNEQER